MTDQTGKENQAREIGARFVWEYVVAPVLVLLPRPWRERVIDTREVELVRAGVASGLYEMIGAVVALGYWYMYEMGGLVDTGIQQAESGKMHGASEFQIAGAALAVFFLHPLTWFLLYLFLEGGLRLCGAAFTETVMGSLPLSAVERLVFWMRHRDEVRVGQTVKENAGSFVTAVSERVRAVTRAELPDQVAYRKDGEDEVLEIGASRRKEEWLAPKIVCIEGTYYRLEESWTSKGERPFRYRLRRLAAGVPGRKVILYRLPEGRR